MLCFLFINDLDLDSVVCSPLKNIKKIIDRN